VTTATAERIFYKNINHQLPVETAVTLSALQSVELGPIGSLGPFHNHIPKQQQVTINQLVSATTTLKVVSQLQRHSEQ